MIVDCGAGTTEVAVISLGRICVSHSVRGGGDALDQALIDHLHLKHRFDIGISTAEQLKLDLLAALESGETDRQIEVRGLDVALGVPATIAPSAGELSVIWDKHAESVAGAVRAALHDTHPELCQDIFDDGITLTGGASTTLLAAKIAEATGVAARVAESPFRSVASGLERILDQRR